MPMLASEYATQLEFSSDYDKALHYYEEALITAKQIGIVTKGDGNKMSEADVEEHNWICKAGYYTTCSKKEKLFPNLNKLKFFAALNFRI